MPVDAANSSKEDLMNAALAKLEARGYSWNRSTTSLAQHLATALSGIIAALQRARATYAAALDALTAQLAGL